MKNITVVIILAAIVLTSCGSTETKSDVSTTVIENKMDTANVMEAPKVPKVPKENKTDSPSAKVGQTRNVVGNPLPGKNDILAHIDQHLISIPQYTSSPSGGFTNCSVKVTNTLTDVTFQKALIELTILKQDGSLLRTDYYTVINIEPGGGTKNVLVPNINQGVKIVTHIIKVKSNELTNGEFVLTGSHFIAN